MEDDATPSVYCSTSGTYFTDKGELAEHYKSDFHRYNLKRKIAGLPPVTKDWFDSRKELLSNSTSTVQAQKQWLDPLTKKRFNSENTYLAYVRSKKYQDLVKKSGEPAPKPYVTLRRNDAQEAGKPEASQAAEKRTHTIKAPNRGPSVLPEEDQPGNDSEWETASEDEMETEEAAQQPTEDWDLRKSLFDNTISDSFESNLEYMWKNFGFYLPDSEYLEDPEGLVQYLGAKLSEGHIPLYVSGLSSTAKQFSSLHAVQQHMVATNQCKLLYDGNEEEYEDFYDYSKAVADETGVTGTDVVMAGTEEQPSTSNQGYELAVPSQEGKSSKVLGSREFLRYYRQNHRPADARRSVQVATLHQRYRNLGIALIESPGEAEAKRAVKQAQKQMKKGDRIRLRTNMQENVNRNLPRNVTY